MKSLYRMASLPGKWLFIALMAFTMQVHAATNQDSAALVTLKVSNAPIEDVFLRIEAQTGFSFTYSTQLIDKKEKVSVDFKREQLGDVLRELLGKRNLRWVIRGAGIVILQDSKPATQIERFSATDSIPKIDVRGVVTDKSGNPIPGATVSLKGQSRGQSTDGEGRFFFTNMPVNGVIQVSSIGFEAKEFSITNRKFFQVVIDSAIREIKPIEVVSTGYETIPKERATGSFVQIDNVMLNRTVSTNLIERLLYVTNSLKPEPGIATNISIRGISTINANMVPLVVVDGFPYDEGIGRGAAAVLLSNINPNDVESVTILRDAAAASIWGARSGNGVIVITTKKGALNKRMSIQVNSNINIVEKQRLNELKLISSADAIEFEKELFNSGYYNAYNGPFSASYSYPIVSPAIEIMLAQKRGEITHDEATFQLQALSNHDVRRDISKYILQQAVSQQYNVNISGGGDKNTYYASIGYDSNIGEVKRNSYNRLTVRVENTFKPIKKLNIDMFVAYTQSNSENNGLDFRRFIADGNRQAAPYTLLADASGKALHTPVSGTLRKKYIDTISTPGLFDWHYKPLEEINHIDDRIKQINARLGGAVRYSVFSGLSMEIRGQYERMSGINTVYNSLESFFTRDLVNRFASIDANGKTLYPIPVGGILDYTNRSQKTWNVRAQLNLNKHLGDHSVASIIGYEVRESEFESNKGRKYGYDPTTLLYASTMDYKNSYPRRPSGNARISDGNNLIGTLNRFRSYFGNAAYTFKNRYTYSMSGRIDGSNYFGVLSNQRNVPLWSSGISWTISEEEFWRTKALPYFKLRVTYGFNGNLNNNATSLPIIQFNTGTNIYNNSNFASLLSPPNPGLTWEKVRLVNIGTDFRFSNDRIFGSIEYYTKKGINLIGSIVSEPTTGFFSYMGNYAGMKGKGIDLMLNTSLIDRKVKWDIGINFSYNIDEVTNYALDQSTLKRATNYLSDGLPIVGQPLYKLYSYRWAGLDPKTGSPRGYIADTIAPFETVIQGNNTQPQDLVYNGNTRAPFFGSIINTFHFLNVSFSTNITYKFGHKFRRESINYNNLISRWGGHSDYTMRWKKPGDELVTNVPALPDTPNDYYSFYGLSEILVERGDVIRFQDVRISYDLNREFVKDLPLKLVQVYIYANNLGVIWKANKANVDPDYTVSPPRSIALGLRVDF